MGKEIVKIEVSGLQDVMKAINKLPARVRDKALYTALGKVGKAYLEGIKANAPKDTGRLSEAFEAKRQRALFEVSLGIRSIKGKKRSDKGGAYYAHMVEFGTRFRSGAHFAERTAKALREPNLAEIRKSIARTIQREARKKAGK